MSKPEIWFSDLTHTAQGISANTFPLGVSFVVSYAKQQLGDEFAFKLFKFPDYLNQALVQQLPAVLCFSNYSWNFELSYKFATLAKLRDPSVVTVFGGPNFPSDPDEKVDFLRKRPNIDFYIELEGELGFVDLMTKLTDYGLDFKKLKNQREQILNTSYLDKDELIIGAIERIHDINVIPSPYLTGLLDEYFDLPLVPMMETTRGCPFRCTFCADGIESKNRVFRYDSQRTYDELHYIASKVKNIDELIITDLNFAMYKQDLDTAQSIAEIQKLYNYPTLFSASAGKNMPKRTIEVSEIIQGWTLGASIQSTDPQVLADIRRSNISSSAYRELIDHGNSMPNSKTHSEIILGLPGDTKEKHFESLRFGIDNEVNSIRMFQAMLLEGTEMANQDSRKKFGLVTKFRTIPGCIGFYDILDEKHPVAEIEEIIVGSDTLTLDDYLECRILNLIVETFHNNAIFEEVYALIRTLGISPFNCLLYIKDHPEKYSERIHEIIKAFCHETTNDLFDTFEEANQYVLNSEAINRYIGGELGTNELLLHRALLFNEFEEICKLLFNAITETLRNDNKLTSAISAYLYELERFVILRKKDSFENTESIFTSMFSYDFEAIRDAGYMINPNDFPTLDSPEEFCFFQDEDQRQHISNQVKIYSQTSIGLGKLIQRSNLKLVFRRFTRTKKVPDGVVSRSSMVKKAISGRKVDA